MDEFDVIWDIYFSIELAQESKKLEYKYDRETITGPFAAENEFLWFFNKLNNRPNRKILLCNQVLLLMKLEEKIN